MKKAKEGLMFVALLVMPLVLFFILPFWGNMLSSIPSFVGVSNYIRMFSNDKKEKSSEMGVLFRQCIYWRGYNFDLQPLSQYCVFSYDK